MEENNRLKDSANRELKSTLFTSYFSIPEHAADLYRGLDHDKEIRPEDIVFTTLEGVLFMAKKNDLGFTVKGKVLIIGEQQSTVNPNMPVRTVQYFGRTLELLIPSRMLYKEKQILIPTPEFYCFYNGKQEQPPEKILRLSDAYLEKTNQPMLELLVKEINVNPSAKHPLLEKSRSMYEYSTFIQRTKDHIGNGLNRKAAIQSAMEDCIREGIMVDFLQRHGSEVMNMLYTKYNVEDALEVRYEEGVEEGIQEGIKSLIETCIDFHSSREATRARLMEKLSLTEAAAEEYLRKYWKES